MGGRIRNDRDKGMENGERGNLESKQVSKKVKGKAAPSVGKGARTTSVYECGRGRQKAGSLDAFIFTFVISALSCKSPPALVSS